MSSLAKEASLSRLRKGTDSAALNDSISDNASVLNQPMRRADKEDAHQTMQKVNPMKDSIGRSARRPVPLPATATESVKEMGRTIEVQTDLSMVTMEQYSQVSKRGGVMNRTHGFDDHSNIHRENRDDRRMQSPNIKF